MSFGVGVVCASGADDSAHEAGINEAAEEDFVFGAVRLAWRNRSVKALKRLTDSNILR